MALTCSPRPRGAADGDESEITKHDSKEVVQACSDPEWNLGTSLATPSPILSLYADLARAFAAERQAGYALGNSQPAESYERLNSSVRGLVGAYMASAQDWRQYVLYDDVHYCRHLIDMNDDFEMLVSRPVLVGGVRAWRKRGWPAPPVQLNPHDAWRRCPLPDADAGPVLEAWPGQPRTQPRRLARLGGRAAGPGRGGPVSADRLQVPGPAQGDQPGRPARHPWRAGRRLALPRARAV